MDCRKGAREAHRLRIQACTRHQIASLTTAKCTPTTYRWQRRRNSIQVTSSPNWNRLGWFRAGEATSMTIRTPQWVRTRTHRRIASWTIILKDRTRGTCSIKRTRRPLRRNCAKRISSRKKATFELRTISFLIYPLLISYSFLDFHVVASQEEAMKIISW